SSINTLKPMIHTILVLLNPLKNMHQVKHGGLLGWTGLWFMRSLWSLMSLWCFLLLTLVFH
ncbi:hypothetical protein PIB30_082817, partial [Stylosanthes scabra]|nr:hypothetical protein [Stylosanthes scabra]